MRILKLKRILFCFGFIFLTINIYSANAADKPPLLNNAEQVTQSQSPTIPPLPPTPQTGVVNNISPPPPPPSANLAQNAAVPVVAPQPSYTVVELKNVSVAVSTAKSIKPFLKAGKVWCFLAPDGRIEIKGAVMYENAVVTVLHFSSLDGSLLPCGIIASTPTSPKNIENQIETVKREFPSIIKGLELLNGAEYLMPERAWSIPVAYNKKIVGHIKIYSDGIHVIPDYYAGIEMQVYGR